MKIISTSAGQFERVAWTGGDVAPENLEQYSAAYRELVDFFFNEDVKIYLDATSEDDYDPEIMRNSAKLDAWATYRESDLKEIINPNSSGQGICLNYRNGNAALTHEILTLGWTYSHSVYIGQPDGTKKIVHCFKRGEHNVSFYDGSLEWQTSVSCASGRCHRGKYASELNKHLRNKIKRYKLV